MVIDNFIFVYQVRNVIYMKCGVLGIFVFEKKDEMGIVVMIEDEKRNFCEEFNGNYGFDNSRFLYGLSDVFMDFICINFSIQELQFFEEILNDVIIIVGVFGVLLEFVLCKDYSIFNNQKFVEKGVYIFKIILVVRCYVSELICMLGYDCDGYYIDVDFSYVDCFQEGQKEKEEVFKIILECVMGEFQNGIIILNDYCVCIGESKVENFLFDKFLYEMFDKEFERVKKILSIIKKLNDNG